MKALPFRALPEPNESREKNMEHYGNEQGKKRCKIEGIRCNVENCYYHDQKTDCTAREISVGPDCAHCSDETVCSTFKPKEEQ